MSERSTQVSSRKLLALGLAAVLGVGACSGSTATPSPAAATQAATTAPQSTAPGSTAPESTAPSTAPASPAALVADPAEAVIQNVEPNAEIGFWTFYLSPTFDQWIKDTIARFEQTYPGVKVNWEDHQATFQDDLNNAFAAGTAPDVINLSVSEGWVSRLRRQGPPPPARRQGPAGREGLLLPGPVEGAARRRRQLPVPLVPGPERRAHQQEDLRGGRRPVGRRLPEDHRRAARRCARRSRTRPARCARSGSRSTTCSRRWSTRATSRSSATTARSSPSTPPRPSPGCRCTLTWSRPARSTTPCSRPRTTTSA